MLGKMGNKPFKTQSIIVKKPKDKCDQGTVWTGQMAFIGRRTQMNNKRLAAPLSWDATYRQG